MKCRRCKSDTARCFGFHGTKANPTPCYGAICQACAIRLAAAPSQEPGA